MIRVGHPFLCAYATMNSMLSAHRSVLKDIVSLIKAQRRTLDFLENYAFGFDAGYPLGEDPVEKGGEVRSPPAGGRRTAGLFQGSSPLWVAENPGHLFLCYFLLGEQKKVKKENASFLATLKAMHNEY
jgi:hypothetical protein